MNDDKQRVKGMPKFILILIISFLPGCIISMACFFNALVYDSGIQNSRMSLANTDLSEVRIENYTLGQSVPEWNTTNISWIVLENGIEPRGYYDATSSFHHEEYKRVNESSPVIYIYMYYPGDSVGEYSDTWKGFTIQDAPQPDFESVTKVLGENYVFVERSARCGHDYAAFIDFDNNLELRFNYMSEKVQSISLMRIDKRSSLDFLANKSGIFDDDTNLGDYYSNSVFCNPNIIGVLKRVALLFIQNRFFLPNEYFSLSFYLLLWIFPMAWFVYMVWKRSIKRPVIWIASVFSWYLLLFIIEAFMTAVSRF